MRRIEAIPMLLPKSREAPKLGAKPAMEWVDPTTLLVDDTYQRELGRRSMGLIARIIREFAWRKMKPPICVYVGKELHCVNGQHTAIAAATLEIPKIPVIIVDGADTKTRADAFVGHNRDQIAIAPLDLYRALVAAGDSLASQTEQVTRRAGVRIRSISPSSKIAPGDCSCVTTIMGMVKRRGVHKARNVLEALTQGGRAPISAAELAAVELVMCIDRPELDTATMAGIIKAVGGNGLIRAHSDATIHKLPVKEVLRTAYNALARKAAA